MSQLESQQDIADAVRDLEKDVQNALDVEGNSAIVSRVEELTDRILYVERKLGVSHTAAEIAEGINDVEQEYVEPEARRFSTLDAANEANRIDEVSTAAGFPMTALVDEREGGIYIYAASEHGGGFDAEVVCDYLNGRRASEIIAEARDLFDTIGDDIFEDADPEYARAVLELTNRLLGRSSDDMHITEREMKEVY